MKLILFLLCMMLIISCQPTTESKKSDRDQESLAQTTGSLNLWLNLLPAPYFYSSVQLDSIGLIDSNENIHNVLNQDKSPLVISSLLSRPSILLTQLADIPVGRYNAVLVTINLENTLVNWIEDKTLRIPFLYDSFGKTGDDALSQITIEIPVAGKNSLVIEEGKTTSLALTLDNYAGHRWIPMDDNESATDLSLLPIVTASTDINIHGELSWVGTITAKTSDQLTFMSFFHNKSFTLPLEKNVFINIDGDAKTLDQLEEILSETDKLSASLKIINTTKGFSVSHIDATTKAATHFFQGMLANDNTYFGVITPIEKASNNSPYFAHEMPLKGKKVSKHWTLVSGFIDTDTLSHYHYLPKITLANLIKKSSKTMTLNILSSNGISPSLPEKITLPIDKSPTINEVGLLSLDNKNNPSTPIEWQSDKPLNFYTALPLVSEFDLISDIDESHIKLVSPEDNDAYQQLIIEAGLRLETGSDIESITISDAIVTLQVEGISPVYQSFRFESSSKAIDLLNGLRKDQYKLMVIAAKGELTDNRFNAETLTLRLVNYEGLDEISDDLSSLTTESTPLKGKASPLLKGTTRLDFKFFKRLFNVQHLFSTNKTGLFLKNQLGHQLPSPIDRQLKQALQTQKKTNQINTSVQQARENLRLQVKQGQKKLIAQNFKRTIGVTITEARKLNVTLSKEDVTAIAKRVIINRNKQGKATSSVNLQNEVSNEIVNQKLRNLKFGDTKTADGKLYKHIPGSQIDTDIEARLKALKVDSPNGGDTPTVRRRP